MTTKKTVKTTKTLSLPKKSKKALNALANRAVAVSARVKAEKAGKVVAKKPKTETIDITPSPAAIMSILAGRPVPFEGKKTKLKLTPRGDISALLRVGKPGERVRINGRYASADGKIISKKEKVMTKKSGPATKVDGRGAKPKFEKSVNGLVRDLFADPTRELTTDEVVTSLTKTYKTIKPSTIKYEISGLKKAGVIVKVGRSEGGDRYRAAGKVAAETPRFATAPGAIGADIVALKAALVTLDEAKAAIERALVAAEGIVAFNAKIREAFPNA